MILNKWRIGNFIFNVNPNSHSTEIQQVGDNVKMLDGSTVSQPTSTSEKHNISSTFFGNVKSLSKKSYSYDYIKYHDGSFYGLDVGNKKIYKFNTNFSITQTISLPAGITGNVVSFDAYNNSNSDGYLVVTNANSTDTIYELNSSGTITKTLTYSDLTNSIGYTYLNGYIWSVRNNSTLLMLDANANLIQSVNLPYAPSSETGYLGITTYNNYIILGYNRDDFTGIYHIDTRYGTIVNYFSLPSNEYYQIDDIAYDGEDFICLSRSKKMLNYILGSVVNLNLYELDLEIKTNGYLDITDDLGITTRIAVSDFGYKREDGYQNMYTMNMSYVKVDRGV